MNLHERRERKHRIQQLRSLPLVAGCTARQLAELDHLGTTLDVHPGAILTTEGSAGRECFVVLSGAAAAQRGVRHLGEVEAGTVAGELALLDDVARSATVVAASSMRLLVLDPTEFNDLLEVAPCVAERVLETADVRRAALA